MSYFTSSLFYFCDLVFQNRKKTLQYNILDHNNHQDVQRLYGFRLDKNARRGSSRPLGYLGQTFRCNFSIAHECIISRIGKAVFPSSVRPYSTRGGTSAATRRARSHCRKDGGSCRTIRGRAWDVLPDPPKAAVNPAEPSISFAVVAPTATWSSEIEPPIVPPPPPPAEPRRENKNHNQNTEHYESHSSRPCLEGIHLAAGPPTHYVMGKRVPHAR